MKEHRKPQYLRTIEMVGTATKEAKDTGVFGWSILLVNALRL